MQRQVAVRALFGGAVSFLNAAALRGGLSSRSDVNGSKCASHDHALEDGIQRTAAAVLRAVGSRGTRVGVSEALAPAGLPAVAYRHACGYAVSASHSVCTIGCHALRRARQVWRYGVAVCYGGHCPPRRSVRQARTSTMRLALHASAAVNAAARFEVRCKVHA